MVVFLIQRNLHIMQITAFNHFTTLPYRQKCINRVLVHSPFRSRSALHINNITKTNKKPGAIHTTERLDPWTQVS